MAFTNDATFTDDFRKIGHDSTAEFARVATLDNSTEFASGENLAAGVDADEADLDEEDEVDDLDDEDEDEELDEDDDDELEVEDEDDDEEDEEDDADEIQ